MKIRKGTICDMKKTRRVSVFCDIRLVHTFINQPGETVCLGTVSQGTKCFTLQIEKQMRNNSLICLYSAACF